jgi:hypothetical protein
MLSAAYLGYAGAYAAERLAPLIMDTPSVGWSAGWLRRHAGEGRLQASQALRAGREGRKPPVEGEGPSGDGREPDGPAQGHALADEGSSEDGDAYRVLIRPGEAPVA